MYFSQVEPSSWRVLATPSPAQLAQGLRGRCHGEPITHSLQTCFGALFDNYSCLPILSELHPGLEGSTSDGHLTSGTEPFCGRFSLHQPRHLALTPPAAQKVYRLDQYTHVSSSHGVCRPGGQGGVEIVLWGGQWRNRSTREWLP